MSNNQNIKAAIAVLSKSEGPLHYKEITKIAIRDGLLETDGKTPDATMGSTLGTDVRKKGGNSKFYRTGPIYGLRSRMGSQSPDPERPDAKGKNKYIEAAITVLSRSEGPMHYKEITKIAIRDGLLETPAKDPAGVTSAILGGDINKNGKNSTFYKTEPGFYDLRSRRGSQPSLDLSDAKGKKTFVEAAVAVLSEIKKPLSAKKITEIAIRDGLIETVGKTPEGSMSSMLATDIKKNGKRSSFYRPKPGMFDLNSHALSNKPVIYIMTNAAMPGFVKVGQTTRGSLKLRLKSMDRTNTPLPFELFYAAEVRNATAIEKNIKIAFEDRMARGNREFYKVEPQKIKAVVEVGAIGEVKLSRQELNLQPEDERALVKEPGSLAALYKNEDD